MYTYAYNGSDRISVLKNISIYDLLRFLRILHISISLCLLRRVRYIRFFWIESEQVTPKLNLQICSPILPML